MVVEVKASSCWDITDLIKKYGDKLKMFNATVDGIDIKKVTLFYGERADPVEPIRTNSIEMEKKASDDLFDYFEAKIQDRYTRVCYYFLLDDGKEQTYYYERNYYGSL